MSRIQLLRIFGAFSVIIVAYGLMGIDRVWTQSNEPEPAPPADQEFIGSKKCSSCHFDEYVKWKKTKHSKAFDLLPAKYQTDAACLKCHTTGFGEPTGYKAGAEADLKGTSCESCHGPGSKHAELTKPFVNKKLTPEQEKVARDSIWKIQPTNTCLTCHVTKGHHESLTPKELRKEGK